MPVLCLLYTYSKAEEERRKRLADLLGLGSGIVDTPSYTSRVVKPRHRVSYTAFARLRYLHTLGFDHFKHAISLGHIHFIHQRPSKLRR